MGFLLALGAWWLVSGAFLLVPGRMGSESESESVDEAGSESGRDGRGGAVVAAAGASVEPGPARVAALAAAGVNRGLGAAANVAAAAEEEEEDSGAEDIIDGRCMNRRGADEAAELAGGRALTSGGTGGTATGARGFMERGNDKKRRTGKRRRGGSRRSHP